jgi:hypothetical protein
MGAGAGSGTENTDKGGTAGRAAEGSTSGTTSTPGSGTGTR